MTLDLNLESTACGRAQAAIGGDHRRALSRPFTGHRRPAASVSIISGCVRTPVHIVVEDHHDALGQRDRFQLLDSFGGRTLRVEQGWDDRVNGATDVINQHIEVVVHLAQMAEEERPLFGCCPALPDSRLDFHDKLHPLWLSCDDQQDVGSRRLPRSRTMVRSATSDSSVVVIAR